MPVRIARFPGNVKADPEGGANCSINRQSDAGQRGCAQATRADESDGSGNFSIHGIDAPDSSLYLLATGGVPAANKAAGDNPAIALIAALEVRVRYTYDSSVTLSFYSLYSLCEISNL